MPVRYLKKTVDFRVSDYSQDVARLLAPDSAGLRPMALVPKGCVSPAARAELKTWNVQERFPEARSPQGAMAGLYLYFGCEQEVHAIAQDLKTPEGSFWHGILHRQEPDAANAGYWFRHLGRHDVFPALRDEARRLRFDTGAEWDPIKFIEFCEGAAARPGSNEEWLAMQVQLVEWQLLFDYCASAKGMQTADTKETR